MRGLSGRSPDAFTPGRDSGAHEDLLEGRCCWWSPSADWARPGPGWRWPTTNPGAAAGRGDRRRPPRRLDPAPLTTLDSPAETAIETAPAEQDDELDNDGLED
ncbi:MAG: hypothetical protein H7Y15_04510 [Pseudonocardia sp.]|nr:hypothetical protein [Pseudonocardia sp.]